jgi:hypothetical protein
MQYMDCEGVQEHEETRTSLIARELLLPSKSPFCASHTPSRCLNTGSRESMHMASEIAALITALRLSKCSPTDFRRSIRWGDRVHLMNAVLDSSGQGVSKHDLVSVCGLGDREGEFQGSNVRSYVGQGILCPYYCLHRYLSH